MECAGCGAVYEGPSRYAKKFCTRECWRVNAAGKHLQTGRNLTCNECGAEFYARGVWVANGRGFCSWGCYNKDRAIQLRQCECGEYFKPKDQSTQYCSHRCSKMGDKNPNWNGGGEYRKILSPDRAWREIVFERDNFTCLICGQRGGRLQAHHLDAYHWCVERRYDIDNGVTLCRDDHIAFHTMFGTKNTTQQDWYKFCQAQGEM